MAKSKNEKTEKFVRLVLPKPIHDDLRIVAAQKGMSMSAYVTDLVTRAVLHALPERATKKGEKS